MCFCGGKANERFAVGGFCGFSECKKKCGTDVFRI